VATIP